MANENIITITDSPQHAQLSRDMGLFSVTMIGVGAMIGAGIFVLTGIAAGHAGPALILTFGLNGAVTLLTAMSYAELGSTFPEAGGGYLWVKKGIGGLHGFQAGWMSWFAHAVACSLYILGFGFYFWEALRFLRLERYIIPLITLISPASDGSYILIQKIFAIIVAVLFGYINFKGASETGKWGSFITILKVLILGGFALFGLIVIAKNPDWPAKFRPFTPMGFGGVLGAMGLTYIAFEGYEIIVQSGEEIKSPARNLPRAIFLSLLIVVPIYLLVGFVAIGATEIPAGIKSAHPEIVRIWQYLAYAKEGAMVEAAKQFMPLGYALMIIGGLFATMSALNATIYSSSRVSFAMGRDKNLPDSFAKIHDKKRTPHIAILVSVALIITMAVVLPIEDVAAGADIMFILLFLQVNMALIALRKKQSKIKRPFKVPLVPFTPILAIGLQCVLGVYLFHVSAIGWATAGIWLVGGVAIYYGYAREREQERSAEKIVYEERIPTKAAYRILVPLAHPKHVEDLMNIAASIAADKQGEILALGVVKVPGQLPVAEGRRYIKEFKGILDRATEAGRKKKVIVNTLIRIGHNVGTAITDTIEERDIDLMVMGWKGFSETRGSLFGKILDDIVMNATCDVVMVKMIQLDKMKSVLVPVAEGPHTDFALQIGSAVARAYGGNVAIVKIIPPGTNESVQANYQKQVDQAVDYILSEKIKKVRGDLVKARSISAGILKLTEQYDACIMGAAREGLMQQILFGSIPERVAQKCRHTAIMVKKHPAALQSILSRFFHRPKGRVGKR